MIDSPGNAPTFSTAELERAYAECARVVKARARNFYWGLRLTPQPTRRELYAVYAWMRAVDDIADRPGPTVAERRAELEEFRAGSSRIFDARSTPAPSGLGSWWPAIVDVVRRHDLAPAPFMEMIDGQVLDLDWRHCADREQLEHFCRLVASTVGRVCVEVWGHDGRSELAAKVESRGIALQLTNILRDVREDHERRRCYLPADELAAAGLGLEDLLAWEDHERCRRFVLDQVERARAHYAIADDLERHLTPECRATSRAMCEIYRGILEQIAANPERVVRSRVGLGTWRKVVIAWRARRRGDERSMVGTAS